MKRVIRVVSIFVITGFIMESLCGCDLSSYAGELMGDIIEVVAGEEEWEKMLETIDEEIMEKDVTRNVGKLEKKTRIIVNDIAQGSTDNTMELFSEKVIEEIGRDELQQSLMNVEDSIRGDIVKYETKRSGGSGHRGGRGTTIKNYTVMLFTDTDIYEVSLCYVTEDSSSDDKEANERNCGLHRIIVEPVSVIYGEEGLSAESVDREYFNYIDKDGAFSVAAEEPARDVKYEGKSYTGYSIVYLQGEIYYDGAKRKSCEKLMDILSSVGFEGDITDIEWLSHCLDDADPDDALEKAYESGYQLMITDEAGTEFFIEQGDDPEGHTQVVKIAGKDRNVLYQNESVIK